METFTMISYQYGKGNYKEDDWAIIATITNEKECYEALKAGYLKDASNRFPSLLYSLPIYREFYLGKSEYSDNEYEFGNEDENGDYEYDFRGDKLGDIYLDIKKDYQSAFDKFEKWEKKLKSLLPRLRESKRKQDDIDNEISQLHRLASKYGYSLIKEEKLILASFCASTYSSAGSTREQCFITEEELMIIKNSKLSMEISLPTNYYTCGSDGDYDLKSNDFKISYILKSEAAAIEQYSNDYEEDGIIKRFIKESKEMK